MVYCGLPNRRPTTRWNALGSRLIGFMDGACLAVGAALAADAFRSFFTPDASILGLLLRWPGGGAPPTWMGFLLGGAFLVRGRVPALVLVAASALAAINVAEFYVLRAQGLRAAALPFSLVTLGLLLAGIARSLHEGRCRRGWAVAGAALAAPALLLGHLLSYGATDYARRADAIVVFGAGVRPDGSPSLALEDRVKHGIRLYREGLAPRLVMSGGPDEVPVMRRLALGAGVPGAAIVEDPAGLNTFATLKNLRERRILAVSHYYHLARIKLAARRLGIACATVPCPMTRRLAREPYFVARECAAFVSYYLLRG